MGKRSPRAKREKMLDTAVSPRHGILSGKGLQRFLERLTGYRLVRVTSPAPQMEDISRKDFRDFQAGGLDAIARRRKRRGHGVERPL